MITIPDKVTFISDLLNLLFVSIVFYFTMKYKEKFSSKYPNFAFFYRIVLISLGIALIGNFVDVLDEFEINGYYLRTPFTTQLTSWIFAITIGLVGISWIIMLINLSERYIAIPITKESISINNVKKDISAGLYLTTTKDPAYETFKVLLSERAGLIISRKPPMEVKKILNLKETPTIWITKIPGRYNINPKNLEYLTEGIANFLERDTVKKVVLIEGIEYLIIENGFKKVIETLTFLKDQSIMTDSVIVVPIRTSAYSEKEISILFEEFKILE